jgi:hypothetical protein
MFSSLGVSRSIVLLPLSLSLCGGGLKDGVKKNLSLWKNNMRDDEWMELLSSIEIDLM